jgi:hypothetical protein
VRYRSIFAKCQSKGGIPPKLGAFVTFLSLASHPRP